MTSLEAFDAENHLDRDPDDLCLRSVLLYYYDRTNMPKTDLTARRCRAHAIWIIAHYPESDIAGDYVVRQSLAPDSEAFHYGTMLWREHIGREPVDARVLANAAAWFEEINTAAAEKWLERAHAIDENSQTIAVRLAEFYVLRSLESTRSTDDRTAYSHKSLSIYEDLLGNATGPIFLDILSGAAAAALRAGLHNKAEMLATELIQASIEFPADGYYGDAVHFGHIILGQVSLFRGEIASAERHLMLAGRTPGSAVLRSFGPDMGLANGLLDVGRAQVVVEYLHLCASFWEPATVQVWIAEIEASIRPDFGPNLDRL